MKANLVRAVFAGVVVAVFLMAGPFSPLAMAHNELLKTDPPANATLKVPPTRIQFWFEEAPDMTVTKVMVMRESAMLATTVHTVSAKVLAADFKTKLAPGKYTVTWQTAGDDSHISKGEFKFTVE